MKNVEMMASIFRKIRKNTIWLLIAILLLLAVLVSGGYKLMTSLGTEKPKLSVLGEWNLGTIPLGCRKERIFEISNEGRGNLQIYHIEHSCGCTAALLSSKIIPPKSKAELKLLFDSKKGWGGKQEEVKIYSNDPREKVKKIIIRANVIARVLIEPRALSFARPGMKKIVITARDVPDFKIIQLLLFSESLSAAISKRSTAEHETTLHIDVAFSGKSTGRLTENLTLLTNYRYQKKIVVPINLHLSSDVRAVPASVFFGRVNSDKKPKRTIKILGANDQLQISKVEKSNAFVIVKVLAEQGLVEIALSDDIPTGVVKDTVLLYVKGVDEPIAVKIYAVVANM